MIVLVYHCVAKLAEAPRTLANTDVAVMRHVASITCCSIDGQRTGKELLQITSAGTLPAAPLLLLKTTVNLPTKTQHDCHLYCCCMVTCGSRGHTGCNPTSLTRSVKGISDSAPRIETLLAMVGASVSSIKLQAHNNTVSTGASGDVCCFLGHSHPLSTISSIANSTRSRFSKTVFFSTAPLQMVNNIQPTVWVEGCTNAATRPYGHLSNNVTDS